jgi:hypothetical protein
MARCAGIKADGGRCGAQAMRNSQWCIGHDPDHAEARRRRASKGGKRGGRGRPIVAAADVAQQMQDLTDKVLSGTLDRADAAVCSQLLNIKLRALEVGRKLKEAEELEARLEELERVLEQRKDSNRWGA